MLNDSLQRIGRLEYGRQVQDDKLAYFSNRTDDAAVRARAYYGDSSFVNGYEMLCNVCVQPIDVGVMLDPHTGDGCIVVCRSCLQEALEVLDGKVSN